MDNNRKPGSAAVDDILQELRDKSAATPGERSVDDILKELKKPAGVGTTPAAQPPPATKAPVAAPPAPAAPPMAKAPVAPPVAAPGAALKVTAEPQKSTPAEQTPPAFVRPAPKETAEPPEPRKKRRDNLGATIWDIDVSADREEMGPRMGKAAALDRVEPDKFAGDKELLSWFSGDEGEAPVSKREQRQIEKLRKQREKEERKAEKRRSRRDDDYDDEPEYGPRPGEEAPDFSGIAAVHLEEIEVDGGYDAGDDFEEDVKIWSAPEKPAPPAPTRPAAPVAAAPRPAPARPIAQAASAKPASWTPAEDFFGEGAAITPPIDFADAAPPPVDTQTMRAASPRAAEPGQAVQTPTHAAPEVTAAATPAPKIPKPTAPVAATTAAAMAAATGAPPPAAMETRAFAPVKAGPAPPESTEVPTKLTEVPTGGTITFDPLSQPEEGDDTKNFDLDEGEDAGRHVPTAAFTQEFGEDGLPIDDPSKNLYVDDMVDDRFREFFSETVIMDRASEEALAEQEKTARRRKRKKSRSAVLTGEFGKLAQQAEMAERAENGNVETGDDFDDYNHLADAEAIEEDLTVLRSTLTRRCILSAVFGALLIWLGLAHAGTLPFPEIGMVENQALVFAVAYLVVLLAAVVVNFTTVASGLVGLVGEPTVDSAPALAGVAALLQGVMLLVNALSNVPPVTGTLFGALAAFLLCFNALGKRVRAVSILGNFQLASAGYDHSAAYVIDSSTDLAYSITKGMNEEYPTLLMSRPTALVKGFLRQSFSQRAVDRRGRLIGWVLLGAGLLVGIIAWWMSEDVFTAVTALAATLCIGAPFSSSLVSGIPSLLTQRGTARVGAVVPGWSAIEELGQVNVVMAGARDLFPPSSVTLKGIKTFEKERIDLAILYAASVLIEGCDTLRDIFLGVIQGKSDMLYKVESLTREPGRGFTAWVQNSRVVVGTREMLQKHDIDPPAIEVEMKFVPEGYLPVYLAVSGKLFAMFIVGYRADEEVHDTLHSLLRSGVSLLVDSDDMNVTSELVERVYDLPPGAVKVLGPRELEIMEPLTAYLPESDGVMTHIGTFSSFIGGMRAAAACAAAEKMANIVQIASMLLACVLCVLLALSNGLAVLSLGIAFAYQLGWTLLVSALPAARRY